MQSIQDVGLLKQAGIKSIGERVCEQCGSTVPVYEKDGVQTSICITCEDREIARKANHHLSNRDKNKINKLIQKYESVPFQEKTTFKMYMPTTKVQEKAKAVALAFAKGEVEIATLFFQGEPGIGKTHLSHAVAEAYRYFKKSVLFIDMPSMLSILRNSYNFGSKYSQEELIALIDQVDLFVLDDIGAEYVRQDNGNESWVTDILIQVVNARKGKSTIYSTNYEADKLIEKYGPLSKRIISRMMENAQIIKLDGDDYRIKTAERELL